jgi:hypothetical protein
MEVSMSNSLFSPTTKRSGALAKSSVAVFVCITLAALSCIIGCGNDAPPSIPITYRPAQDQFETSGEEFLINALDEVESVANLAQQGGSLLAQSKYHKQIVSSTQTDTTYIYGELTPDGYGAVVTERHTYPKGLLLITVRKSFGKPPAKIVSQVKRYISFQDFLADSVQQSSVTELYGLSTDTLVTHVTRNGLLETYTFRLPVVTRVTSPVDGSVRVTSRFASAGAVRSEIRDGGGNLIQFRDTYGDSTGALTTYTQFANSSWRKTRTIGLSDGSVHHEITSGP